MRIFRRLAWVAVVLGLGACSSPPVQPEAEARPELATGRPACFFARSVRRFEVLDNTALLVWAPSLRCPYRVELQGYCNNLDAAHGIAFDTRGAVCSDAGASLVFRDMGEAGECRVGRVSRLSQSELAQVLEAYGKPVRVNRAGKITPDCEDLPPPTR